MSRPVFAGLDGFAGQRVVVVGDAMLDAYLHGVPRRLCREAPVPIVDVTDRDDAPGGAANTAANLASLGADVSFLSVVGDDDDGRRLRATLEELDVSTDTLLVDPSRQTLLKQRIVAGDQLLARVDSGSTHAIDDDHAARLRAAIVEALVERIPVVISDYGYGAVPQALRDHLAELRADTDGLLVVDAKDPSAYAAARPTAVKPNYAEAVAALGLEAQVDRSVRAAQIEAHGHALLERTGAHLVAVTLDTEGAVVFERGRPAYRSYAEPAPQSHAAGAGDTFVAALTLALATGLDAPAAIDVAQSAAATVVARDGTTRCTLSELRARLAPDRKMADDAAIAVERLAQERRLGRRIVFTNGCFDILHRGHITYLDRAKALGDVLVVAVNTDDGVRRLKGPERPINPYDDRAAVLAALSCVDVVVPFAEDTPVDLLDRIRPDVYVKGGDYRVEDLPEAAVVDAYGGEARILAYVEDRSTTSIIERIRRADGRPPIGDLVDA